ncbi:DUF1918 domain-containing protein [Streptomyces virginiae]
MEVLGREGEPPYRVRYADGRETEVSGRAAATAPYRVGPRTDDPGTDLFG